MKQNLSFARQHAVRPARSFYIRQFVRCFEQMGSAQVKILAKLAFGKAAALNAVTCDGAG
jgi:hypothetical protein